MAGVMPKVKTYVWLSVICLMINLSIFANTLIASGSGDINNFLDNTDEDDYTFGSEDELPGVEVEGTNSTISDFAISTGTSFVPFFSLLGLILLGEDLPTILTVIVGVVIGIISAIQVFLLAMIILNLAPKVLGSGFDV